MNFTKTVKADLDSPRRELSHGGLGIVVTLLVRWQIFFCVRLLGVQSSCINSFPCSCRLVPFFRHRGLPRRQLSLVIPLIYNVMLRIDTLCCSLYYLLCI